MTTEVGVQEDIESTPRVFVEPPVTDPIRGTVVEDVLYYRDVYIGEG